MKLYSSMMFIQYDEFYMVCDIEAMVNLMKELNNEKKKAV